MRSLPLFVTLALGAAAATGCSRPSSRAETPPAAPLTPEAEARQIFDTRCTPCHGADGTGNGPASAARIPKPRNFHDASWQASVTDAHIENIIRVGGAAVGKSAFMPPNADLVAKPAVVTALRTLVRGFR